MDLPVVAEQLHAREAAGEAIDALECHVPTGLALGLNARDTRETDRPVFMKIIGI